MFAWMAKLALPDLMFAVLSLLFLAGALVEARRRGSGPRRLRALGVFGAYLVVLAVIILCPLPGPRPGPEYFGDPGNSLLEVDLHLDLRGMLTSGMRSQDLQNLLLCVPFGFGLPFLVRWSGRRLAVVCSLVGVALETSQAVACGVSGLLGGATAYRSVDVNDAVSNSAGALIGLTLFAIVNWRFSLRSGPRGRTAAVGTAITLCAAGVVLLLGPMPELSYGPVCQAAPADAITVAGYPVYLDGCETVCVGENDVWLTPEIWIVNADSPRRKRVRVFGVAPAETTRAQVILADGTTVDAELATIGTDRVYGAVLKSTDTDDPAARVRLFDADGNLLLYVGDR